MAEIKFLGALNHPNLVNFLGYCGEDNHHGIQRLLVYEFMPNRSLEDHLFTKGLRPLTFETRLKIMLGVAQALRYLHEEIPTQVIYYKIYFYSFSLNLDNLIELKTTMWNYGLWIVSHGIGYFNGFIMINTMPIRRKPRVSMPLGFLKRCDSYKNVL